MSQAQRFDVLVLGSGEGGKFMAWHMARSGRRAAVVERRWIGGSCPNINCLPSKNEIWSAKVADLVHHAAKFGLVTGPAAINMAAVRQRKREMVEGLIALHHQFYKASGAELIMGSGIFVAPKTLEVRLNDGGTQTLIGEQIFLNVGTHATIPQVPGLAAAQPLTHIEVLELDRLPEHLIVLGGGYVGLEFAQAYRRFGSRVTVVEHGVQLLSREDPDIAGEIRRILTGEGIEIVFSAEALRVEGRSGAGVSLVVRTMQGEQTLAGSDLLVAAGRTPNTAGIGLELAGVELDARGYIKVNDRLETTAADTWAIGECAGSPQFTHVSNDDFRIIRDNLAGGNRTTPPAADSLLSVHRSATRAGWLERRRSRAPRHCCACCQVADGIRAAHQDARGNRRIHENAGGRARRPHPRLQHDRTGGWRGYVRGSDGDAGGPALYGLTRRHSHAPNNGRGA